MKAFNTIDWQMVRSWTSGFAEARTIATGPPFFQLRWMGRQVSLGCVVGLDAKNWAPGSMWSGIVFFCDGPVAMPDRPRLEVSARFGWVQGGYLDGDDILRWMVPCQSVIPQQNHSLP